MFVTFGVTFLLRQSTQCVAYKNTGWSKSLSAPDDCIV